MLVNDTEFKTPFKICSHYIKNVECHNIHGRYLNTHYEGTREHSAKLYARSLTSRMNITVLDRGIDV